MLFQPVQKITGTLSNILTQLIGIALSIGIIKIALTFCNEQKPKIAMLFNFSDCFWKYLFAAILYFLIVVAGIILLVVPGIIWAVKFALFPYYVVDKGLGPVEALKASSRTTMCLKWPLFGFGILCVAINMAGFLCLIVGIFATYPMVLVAKALVYRQLHAQTERLTNIAPQQISVQ